MSQNDCRDAIIVCGNTVSDGLSVNGVGTQELSTIVDCGSQEHNSIWLRLNIASSGTLSFTLTPKSTAISEDFDFFIFGPTTDCNNLGNSIRCSTTNPQASSQPNNLTGLNASETDLSEGPAQLGNSFLKQLDVFAGESYYLVIDRPIGNSDFDITWGGTATFNPPPTIDLPDASALDLVECDKDASQDGRTVFNLLQNNPIIINSQPDVAVTYHVNSNDAIIGESPILNPGNFRNTTNPQTLYARITNVHTLCYSFAPFTILVDDFVNISDTVFEQCDDDVDGNDTNGKVVFDMNEVTDELLAGNNLSLLSVAYFRTQAEALSDSNMVPMMYENEMAGTQSLFLKVRNAEGCFVIREVTLVVKPLPSLVHTTLTQCDPGIIQDGSTLFNLRQADSAFVGTDPSLSVLYYQNTSDAIAGINPVSELVNSSNPQQIIAKVSSSLTGCSRLNTLTLAVTAGVSTERSIYECDVLGRENGIATFDLTAAGITITAAQTLRYFRSKADALREVNEIDNVGSYENATAYNDFVVARIEEGNSCVSLIKVNLVVNGLPNIEEISDGTDYVCIDQPLKYIIIDAALIESDPEDFEYIWYLDGNRYAASTYSIAVNKPGVYTVEVINANACRKTRTIEVKPSNVAMIAGVDVVDFIVESNSISVITDPLSIGDYEYSLNSSSGPYQDAPAFEGVPAGFHTVYVRDKNGCGILSRDVAVLGLPRFFTPNGDGVHDKWQVDGLHLSKFPNTKVYIFNKFGKLLKEIAAGDTAGWDGTYQGSALPADDYWYTIELWDGRMSRGHFALKR